jgi:uncharacterized membrane protein (UPF0127 family)
VTPGSRGRPVLIAGIGVLLVIGAVLLGLGIAKLTTNTTVVTATRGVQSTTATTSPLTRAIEDALAHQHTAVAPFKGLTEVRLSVGGKCLRLVVADSPAELAKGLRGRDNLGPYGGMIFVFNGSVDGAFTMSGTKTDLDVGFFAADGTSVDRVRMTPCTGTDAECPQYRSRVPYRFALETLTGRFPDGALAPCTT